MREKICFHIVTDWFHNVHLSNLCVKSSFALLCWNLDYTIGRSSVLQKTCPLWTTYKGLFFWAPNENVFVNILLLFLDSFFCVQRWHSRPKLYISSIRENGIEVEIFNIFLQISFLAVKNPGHDSSTHWKRWEAVLCRNLNPRDL